MDQNKTVSAGDTEILAIRLEGGPALIVRYRDGNEEAFIGDEAGVAAFSVRTGDMREIMRVVRAVAAQLIVGDLNPDIVLPARSGPGLSVIAEFSGTNGNLRWVADDAPAHWTPLARAAQRASFVMRPSDIRTIRNLSDEPYPGILRSPFGEIAYRDGRDWIPVDDLDADEIAQKIVPRVAAHLGANGTQEAIFTAVLGLTSPEVAHDAVFG